MSAPVTPTTPALQRRLSAIDAAAIIVSNVIGGGILFTPPQIAANIPNAVLFLGVWLAGGLLAFAGAMSYAELAAMRPRAGGEYVYLRDAYGRMAAFLTGWTSFIAGFSGAVAASAVVLADYLGRFIPGAADKTELLSLPLPFVPLTVTPQAVVAIVAIAGMSWIHIRGVGPGRMTVNILATLKFTALVVFVAAGFAFGRGSLANATTGGAVEPANWVFALIAVMFTYSGWNAAVYVAEEVREPGRNVPRALAIGTGAVVALYLALNLLYLYVFPVNELAQVKMSVLDAIADRLLGEAAGNIMAIVAVISISASISAMVFAGPRVYYAMARDGLFLDAARRIHPRYNTPAVSIVAQGVWSSVLVLSAPARELVGYTGFAVTLFAGVAVAAVFVLRYRHPEEPRPFRAWGYPVAPAIFAVSSFVIVVNAVWQAPGTAAAGLILIGLGIPVYLVFAKRSRNAVTPS